MQLMVCIKKLLCKENKRGKVLSVVTSLVMLQLFCTLCNCVVWSCLISYTETNMTCMVLNNLFAECFNIVTINTLNCTYILLLMFKEQGMDEINNTCFPSSSD